MAPNDTQRPKAGPLPKDPEKRRRELQRRKLERQAQLRAQRVAETRKRTLIIGGCVVAVAAIAAGIVAVIPSSKPSKSASADTASSSPSTAANTPAAAKANYTITPKKNEGSWKTEPPMTIDTSANYTAKITLGQGPVTLKLDAAAAPHTVNSFVFLANQHFFDGVYCHRLTTTGIYVLQCGDPTGTGSGGPGYQFKDENLTASAVKGGTYPAGTVAMANSGPNTNGSQFFLVYKDSPLPASYTPFGTITGGLDVLNAIAAKGSDSANGQGDGKPVEPVIMNTVTASKN
ncbi:peptidylprolyl isomerase [Streptacidiphilus pinicola]|uniref:Peptidyl-prolyl cis-trans isomerase n=1 Tax=Streptacidiphilus pinicola TaxID=2219663 RepID=A0A2X0IZW7_9ACTN|nr:peptidylprolyl isomerase [Streptacidiphilus pinicola]RAG83486.1 peptidylprolyl isomerase [Streptacidiphilus pinicola]